MSVICYAKPAMAGEQLSGLVRSHMRYCLTISCHSFTRRPMSLSSCCNFALRLLRGSIHRSDAIHRTGTLRVFGTPTLLPVGRSEVTAGIVAVPFSTQPCHKSGWSGALSSSWSCWMTNKGLSLSCSAYGHDPSLKSLKSSFRICLRVNHRPRNHKTAFVFALSFCV